MIVNINLREFSLLLDQRTTSYIYLQDWIFLYDLFCFTVVDACAYPYGAPESALTNLPAASHLVNGRGRFENNTAPLEIHKVEQGQEYMFRITNAGFDDVFEVKFMKIFYD